MPGHAARWDDTRRLLGSRLSGDGVFARCVPTLRAFCDATRAWEKTVVIALQRIMDYRDQVADVFLDAHSLEI